jgi:predicted AAA+ superfamily ATPase
MNNLQHIIERQKKEIKERLKQRVIDREILEKIRKTLENDIVKVITGVRRSGKSTLAFLLLKDKNFGYVNFDEKELTEQKLDDILSALKEIYGDVKLLLFDEIQNVNGWELWINSLQRRGYKLVITGSNAKLLSKELATHLTGRYLEFENYPFNFREFLKCENFDVEDIKYSKEKQGELKNLLRKYLEVGGFPEYILKNLDKSYLETLFRSIIYVDVVKRWNVKYPTKIEDLARYLISIHSKEYTATKLRNLLGFRSTLTVEKYVKYLEEAYLIFSLERFSFKPKEFLKAPRKIYVVDLGLANTISTRVTENIGKLMENLVFLELKIRGLKENRQIFYFKINEKEVDFVIKEGLKVKQLIQVTYASSKDEIEKREIRALLKAARLLNCKDLLCITWDYEDEIKAENKKIKFLPLWKWLLSEKF